MSAIVADSIRLTVNGTPIEGVTEISYDTESDQRRVFTFDYEACGEISVRWSGWYRLIETLQHAANLRNPRWLKRRARMARKKRRGWA